MALCGKDSEAKWVCEYLSFSQRQALPAELLTDLVSFVCNCCLTHDSQTGETATLWLLLMMRANVRLVSMNIDVEDRLFHRTEGGKMAAL